MATLTKSWQSLKSVTLYSGISFHLDAKYSSQSTANNTTTVQFRLRSAGNKWRTTSGTAKFTGAYTDSKSCATYPDYIESGDTIISISKTVTHNADGAKSLSIGGSVQAYIDGASRSASISKQTVTLPKINRLAIVSNTSDFTDEENPTLEFTNPGGFNVYPYLNFYDDAGTKVHTLYRGSSSVTSPYTWNITDAERTEIRKATNKQQKYKVNVGVETYNGTTYIGYNSKAQTMTYVNATPSESTVFAEINQKVIDILGTSNANTIIQNVSKIKLTSKPNVKKEATVTKINFEHNAISVEDKTSPYEYTFTPANSKFKVTITDSRNYSKANEYTKTIIEYATVNIDKCSFKRENPTSSNIILNAQIRYKQTTFGSKVNTPTIKWKLGESGTLHTLTSSEYTVDTSNKRITISNLVLSESLDYTSEARFYLYVNDLLTEDTENELVLRGIPTCDMGEHDFQVNGDLFVADINRNNAINILNDLNKFNRENYVSDLNEVKETGYCQYNQNTLNTPYNQNSNWGKFGVVLTLTNSRNSSYGAFWQYQIAFSTDSESNSEVFVRRNINNAGWYDWDCIAKRQNILWQGEYFMKATQEIDLSLTPISSQLNGIVLVFSAYSDGKAQNWDFLTHFVPKEMVTLHNGAGHDIFLNTAYFDTVGGKYLYIYDNKIKGHENNEKTGTGKSGITYNNKYWVLRYVIGV